MLELARRLPMPKCVFWLPRSWQDVGPSTGPQVFASRLAESARLGLVPWLATLCIRTLWHCLVHRPDLIVCGHVVTAPAALLARRLLGRRYVVFAYGYEVRRRRWKRLLGRLLRGANAVAACSRFTRQAVLALGVAPRRIHVVYPGVDAARFAPNSAHRTPHTLLSVARLAELYKGHDTLIRVLPLVRARCTGARLRIAGDGPLRSTCTASRRRRGRRRGFLGKWRTNPSPSCIARATPSFS
jgi:glycosyltransferase involved in cell wall biosynthesis